MGKPNVKKSGGTNSKQQTAEKADERPEWLPDGWDIEVRTRKSGPTIGSPYKCYIDPSNTYRFYSKPEVFRHLEATKATKDSNCSSKKKGSSKHPSSKEEEKRTKSNQHSPSKEEEKRAKSNQHSPCKEEEKCINMHSPSNGEEKYINMHSPSKDGEKSSNTHSPSNTAEKADERPEWLPDGWDIEVRTRKSGPAMGSAYKCYIDPSNTYRFYSKPEVFRHLEATKATKDSNCPSKKMKGSSKHPPSKEEEKRTKSNLHSPSKEEEKRTKSNEHSPCKEEEKCVNMHSSSNGEEKYINMHSPIKDGEKSSNTHSPSNVGGENSTVEDLPPGWIKEVKIRKHRSGIKKDWFYIDPVSGYVFHSKKDVQRYLESGDIGKCAMKPSRRQYQDEDNSTPSPAAKRQKPKQSTPMQKIFVAKEPVESLELPGVSNSWKGEDVNVSSGMMVALDTSGESLKVNHSNHSISKNDVSVGPRFSRRLAGVSNSWKGEDVNVSSGMMVALDTSGESLKVNHSNHSISKNDVSVGPRFSRRLAGVSNSWKGEDVNVSSGMMVALDTSGESLKVNHSNHSLSKSDVSVGHRFSRRLAGVEPVKLADNVINDQTLLVPKRNSRKNRTTLGADMENKSSKHFNGVPEIEQLKPIDTGNTLSEVVFKEQPHQLERDKIEDNKAEFHSNSNKSSKKKEPSIPRRASKRLAGSEHGMMNSISCEKASKYKSKRSKEVMAESQQSEGGPVTEITNHALLHGETGSKRRKSPKVTPAADNQVEKLEVDDEKSEPQLSFTFHYSWSDPCLDYAINTLTGVLPPADNSVDNGPSTVPDIQKPAFDTVTGRSGGSQNNSVDNGPATIHETDVQKTSFDSVTRRSNDSKKTLIDNVKSRDKNPSVQLNKTKRKKEVIVPMRLSKRLAGIEPEASPSDKALEYSSRKPCKVEPTATTLLTNGASNHLYGGEETKLTRHASDSLKTEVLGESSRKSGKSSDTQTVRKEQQLERAEAKNVSNDRSKSELTLPFGESWSDPCLEFAFKTLTGALPVDSSAEIFKVLTPSVGDPPNNELYGRVTTSMNKKAHGKTNQSQNKNERNMDGESSKILLGQPELRTSSISGKNVPKFTNGECHSHEGNIIRNLEPVLRTSPISGKNVSKLTTRESHDHEDNIMRNLFGEPLYVEDENTTQLLHHSKTNAYSQIHEEPLKKNGQVDEGEFGTLDQPPGFETKTLNHGSGESHIHEGKNVRNLEPVLRTSSTSGKNVSKLTTRESHNHEDSIMRNLFGEPLYVEDENTTQLLHHSRTNAYSQIHEEPLKKNHQVAEGEFVTSDQPPGFETGTLKKNHQVAEGEFGTSDQPPGFETKMFNHGNGESHNHEGNSIRNLEPVLRTSSPSGKNVSKLTTGEFHSHEDNIMRSLFGEPLYVEDENTTQLLHHSRTNAYSQIHEEPVKKDVQVAEGEFGTSEQPPPFQTETLNHDNTELQFCESFMNSWSDPCLEFAFKTLTGVIPVEENLAVQGGIQEPVNRHDGRDGVSPLPDFGSSSFSQSDFSFHFDTGVKSTPGQQSSVSSSFPSLSLQGCPGVDPQQQYSQFNNNFQRR